MLFQPIDKNFYGIVRSIGFHAKTFHGHERVHRFKGLCRRNRRFLLHFASFIRTTAYAKGKQKGKTYKKKVP